MATTAKEFERIEQQAENRMDQDRDELEGTFHNVWVPGNWTPSDEHYSEDRALADAEDY